MTGRELALIRHELYGTTETAKAAFGRALGLAGTDFVVDAQVRRLETMAKIPKGREIIANLLYKRQALAR